MGRELCLWLYNGNMRDPLEGGNVLCHDYINVSILVVKLHNSFARCYHWKKLGKGHNEISLFYSLQAACESTNTSK